MSDRIRYLTRAFICINRTRTYIVKAMYIGTISSVYKKYIGKVVLYVLCKNILQLAVNFCYIYTHLTTGFDVTLTLKRRPTEKKIIGISYTYNNICVFNG